MLADAVIQLAVAKGERHEVCLVNNDSESNFVINNLSYMLSVMHEISSRHGDIKLCRAAYRYSLLGLQDNVSIFNFQI